MSIVHMAALEIHNPVAGSLWLVAGGLLAYRYYHKRVEVEEILKGETTPKPTPEEADRLRARLIGEAFMSGGVWLVFYVMLALLF